MKIVPVVFLFALSAFCQVHWDSPKADPPQEKRMRAGETISRNGWSITCRADRLELKWNGSDNMYNYLLSGWKQGQAWLWASDHLIKYDWAKEEYPNAYWDLPHGAADRIRWFKHFESDWGKLDLDFAMALDYAFYCLYEENSHIYSEVNRETNSSIENMKDDHRIKQEIAEIRRKKKEREDLDRQREEEEWRRRQDSGGNS